MDALSFELHVAGGNQSRGPGTRLIESLPRGDADIHPLHRRTTLHIVITMKLKNERKWRNQELTKQAWEMVLSSGARLCRRRSHWPV